MRRFPHRVVIDMPRSARDEIVFWLWENVGNSPHYSYRLHQIFFDQMQKEMKTPANRWRYQAWPHERRYCVFYFANLTEAIFFKLRWA